MSDDYKPRFAFEITREQQKRASELLSHYGLRKAVFSRILDDVLDIVEEHGGAALGILMAGVAKPREIIPSIHKAIPKEDKEDG